MTGRDINEYRRIFDVCTELMRKIQSIPQPVIAEVQGIATAAGCQLVATCDLAIAAEEAALRDARRENRPVLHHADGGADARHRPQARAADAAHRRDGATRGLPPMGPDQSGGARGRAARGHAEAGGRKWPRPVRWWWRSASRRSTRRSISTSPRRMLTPRKSCDECAGGGRAGRDLRVSREAACRAGTGNAIVAAYIDASRRCARSRDNLPAIAANPQGREGQSRIVRPQAIHE